MSVLDLFRNQQKEEEEELEEQDQNNDIEAAKGDESLNGLIVAEPNDQIIQQNEIKDGNIENTCLFSHFSIDEVYGWQSFVSKKEYDEVWPSIKEQVSSGVRSYEKYSKNKK
ncbi:hypothetical protein ENUP19_0339G0018 [Entamoeba nuttalli]|uniref:Uncharacterized protein n=1 Tax=Entamoeba nuttalli TaxID=412467 RepID=A0ABQ0DX35_9EUKA